MTASHHVRRIVRAAACAGTLLLAMVLGACASTAKAPNERVTGDCRALLVHCSSRQTIQDLDANQRAALEKLQERAYPGMSAAEALSASAAALRGLGYTVLSADTRVGLVHAELDQVVTTQSRRRERAFLKLLTSATGLPIRGRHLQGPDHESVRATALARPDPGAHGALLHIEFEETVVDSKGDSKTTTPTEPERYAEFFAALDSGSQRAAQHF
jgi:hypothetical protein